LPTIIYVDNDDEITSAAARIRVTDAGAVALVIPNGSRLSTSRINFRLLAREAQTRGRRLAIVAGEGSTRALAASAGLPVFGSVGEFEESLGDESAAPVVAASLPPVAPQTTRRAAGRTPVAEPRPAAPIPAAVAASHAPTAHAPAPPPEERTTAIVLPALLPPRVALGRPAGAVIAAVAALALLVLGVAAYLLLPSAMITVTPHQMPVAPLTLSVRADPAVTASDPVAGVVPAQRLNFDVASTNTFTVKGRRIAEAKASGRVTFRSYNTGGQNTIPAGSVVSTEGGIQFKTQSAARLARAQLVPAAPGFAVIPSKASVDVVAVRPGTGSNVQPNTITVVPRNEDPVLTKVTNADPTVGGTHDEFPRIEQADIDAAVAQLSNQLDQDFETILAQPGRVPAALTAFPDTRTLRTVPSVDPATLLGQEVDTFDLGMTGTGSVIAVDQSLVTALAADRIRASAATGNAIVDGSVHADLGQPAVDGESVVFPVTARANQARVVDQPSLVELIKGKPISQARAALAPYGDVQVSVWPDWVTSIPTIDSRIDLEVAPPTAPAP
jgi:hypothetical protein